MVQPKGFGEARTGQPGPGGAGGVRSVVLASHHLIAQELTNFNTYL